MEVNELSYIILLYIALLFQVALTDRFILCISTEIMTKTLSKSRQLFFLLAKLALYTQCNQNLNQYLFNRIE